MIPRIASTVLLLCGIATSTHAQSATPPLSSSTRAQVIDSVIKQLRARYVLPDSVERVATALLARQREGKYDSLSSPSRFANAVSGDMYAASHDGHLALRFDPQFERQLTALGFASSAARKDPPASPQDLARFRLMNYGVPEARVLDGNVGYLRITQWVDLQYSKSTLSAALALLANSDAIIVDVRGNPGGYRNAVDYVTSYLVGPRRTELLTNVWRDSKERVRFFTDTTVPFRTLQSVPVFVLTNQNSGSGSEVFAFQLQSLGRGTTVGQTTAGAGYGNLEAPVGSGFVLYISTFRHEDPRTKKGFQGVGVKPDIEFPAASALPRAHAEALRSLSVVATDTARKNLLTWMQHSVEAEARGPRPMTDDERMQIVGNYTGSLKIQDVGGGKLTFTGVSGVAQPLIPLYDGTFELADPGTSIDARLHVQFDSSGTARSEALWLIVPDGRRFKRPRVDQ